MTITLLLIGYAAVTGARPPVVRATVLVVAYWGALFFHRVPLMANSFALAWLVVIAMNPTHAFDTGCQLSFLAVAMLGWGTERWFQPHADPLDRLVDAARPRWERWLRSAGSWIGWNYAVTFSVWLGLAPLIAFRYHLLSPVAVIIGPPVVWLVSAALIAGFLFLLACAVGLPLAAWFGAVAEASFSACEWLVNVAERVPCGHVYVAGAPAAWLWVLYVGLGAFLVFPSVQKHWRWVLAAAALWACIALIGPPSDRGTDELRCTFLAVGHGGCTVLETPDGRVLLYDAGAIAGPEVAQRHIAPFLWSRGITRIDEIFLSHADLDHFNGVPALLERFTIAQATCTPTFADKHVPGVGVTLAALRDRGVPLRIVQAGDRLRAGEMAIHVLHPPPRGPEGKENFRSMVLHITYGGQGLLLTGDLEGPGLETVVQLPPPRADVLMAPHHGSRAGNRAEFHNRAALISEVKPNVIVACQDRPRSTARTADPYAESGVAVWGTWPHGAVTIRFRPGAFCAETYRTGLRLTSVAAGS